MGLRIFMIGEVWLIKNKTMGNDGVVAMNVGKGLVITI